MPIVTIDNRSLIAVSGEDAVNLLQGLITTDLDQIGDGETWPGALLTPQGKILFEFLVSHNDDGLLLETASDNADALIKRLMLYRLRAKADFRKLQETLVTVFWDAPPVAGAQRDMRFARAGIDLYRLAGASGVGDYSAYTELRHVHGISGGAEDGPLTDYFPHDLLMDSNGGLSFKKGCYIGQEVVSRMQHRATARRRLVSIAGEVLPGPSTPILAGEREIGSIIASSGETGLAVVRIDKAGAAIKTSTPITADGRPINLALPAWSGLDFPIEADEAAS